MLCILKPKQILAVRQLTLIGVNSFTGKRINCTHVFQALSIRRSGDVFGVPSRQFLRGDVAFKADVKGNIGAFNDITFNADFSDAVLMADAFYWMKPKGESANGRVRIQQKEGRTIVDDLTINGAGVDVKGAFSLSSAGKLERASFKKLSFAKCRRRCS